MPDAPSRLITALEGRYRIERELGEGGMATVYLADDLKHERKVALKVLKPELAAVVGAERFLAEIKTTANLQHPHILPLFDSGEADSFLFYVMPYVEGETLKERIDREKQLSVADAVDMTRKIADALDYAHEGGIVHRDIKPGNILVSDRGEPIVADFGIALAVAQAGAGRITETGLSLGTPHYMSPEQATGDRDVDPRSDVYALGCVLYELLAGQPPFMAATAQAILVQILTTDAPSITAARRTVPAHIGHALSRALEKLPADRFATAKDFADALIDESFTHEVRARTAAATASVAAPAAPSSTAAWLSDGRTRALAGFAILITAFASLAALGVLAPPAPDPPVQRYAVDMRDLDAVGRHTVMISPDGRRLAFASRQSGQSALYWREIGEERFQRIETGDVPIYPTFSHDGEWLAYVDLGSRALMRVALSGGAPRPIVPSPSAGILSPHWSAGGTITYSASDGIWAVPGTGGEPRLLMATQEGYAVHPRLLPGEEALIFTNRRDRSTYVLELGADSARLVAPQGVDARYLKTGHLLFADPGGGLWAQPFDLGSLATTGDAVPLLGGVGIATGSWARYSISEGGTLVYSIGGAGAGFGAVDESLFVYDFEGNASMLSLEARDLAPVSWAPDGETVAFESTGPSGARQEAQIFTYNTVLGDVPRPLTFDGENENPEWSPDGTRIVFDRTGEGTDGEDLFVKNFGDDAAPELLISLPGDQQAYDWPTDDIILFETVGSDSWNIWVYDFAADSAYPYLEVEANVTNPKLSPDGRRVAYAQWTQRSPSGIYVRSFPDPRQPELVASTGSHPRWSPDGGTLYYWAGPVAARNLVSAQLRLQPSFAVTATDTILTGSFDASAWDIHPDGDRFIVPAPRSEVGGSGPGGEPEPIRFVVAVNWFEELLTIVGEGR